MVWTQLIVSSCCSTYSQENMGTLRLTRTVQRTYIGRRSGCSQPVIIALLVFSTFVFIIFQMANLIPRKPAPLTFAWASSAVRDIAVYVRPDQPTAHLQPARLCKDPPFVLIMVPSAINHSLERDTIRRTWGQWAGSNLSVILANDKQIAQKTANKSTKKPPNVLTVHSLPPKAAKVVFLLGAVRGEDPVSISVREESRLFGDILVEDFIDSYTNLTLKTVFMLKWAQQHCSKAQYIMKVDDDIFLNVPNLQQSLLNKTTSPLMTGSLICGARPIHNQWSKWYTPRYMFREGKYPNYLSGTGYVMSGDLVKPLLNAAITTPYFHLEDVFLTGICAKKIGVRPTDNIGFSYHPRAVNACIYREVIMGHEVIPLEMVRLWNMMNQPKLVAKCRPMKKSQIRSYFPVKCTWR
ncbi:beta-1,3-galactosyltransferase 1-like isoform X2 [Eriocheir sinensis]|uniref:beta-1,3-galactosyltransferase 1-like isoform X2 n=1 Tax=Eriocheir sinensis TaxID=95602 RepID=UPI0021C6F835|nr:beta-1,3-galactosyltransferase 1-like isoform X2 [Eriocheir sinensis]